VTPSPSMRPERSQSPARSRLLDEIATQLPESVDGACVLVGVDGPDGSGKTIFADELASVVGAHDRPVLRISLDDFHNPREIRHRRGRDSPVGFWLDSYNYPRFIADVLDPLSPTGDRRYRPIAHNLQTDAVLDPPWRSAPERAVVIIDGLFLHRDGLADRWAFSIFLDVAFHVAVARMAARDGTVPDPDHPSMRRYVDAQRIYFSECSPKARATVVVDNADVTEPALRADIPAGTHEDPCDLTIENYASETDQYLAQSAGPAQEVLRYLDDFAALVPGGHVLELGSGPGWDADHLERQGVRVSRTDATASFVERLRAAGHEARLLDARSADYDGPFDGVLADAVLLHLSRGQAEEAFHRTRRAVVPHGVLGITLKEGDGAEWTTAKLGRPRYFTYWRAADLTAALARAGWLVHSLRRVQGRHEPWLFVIARAG
jgi:uridine kinase